MVEYLRSLWKVRYFCLTLVGNDLRNRYRRSVIGVGWSLLNPVAMTVVLSTVFAQLFDMNMTTYAPFLLTGLVTWNFIVAVTSQGCHCFLVAQSYIRQHPAPLAVYPLRTMLAAAVHFLIGLVVVVAFTCWMQGFAHLPALLGALGGIVLLLVFGCSLAVCTGVANVIFQDSQHLVEILLQIVFYVTPIIYPAELLKNRGLGGLVQFNPVAALVTLIRDPIVFGRLPPIDAVGIAVAATAVAAAVAALLLWRVERRIVFYL
jgi:lipopolysaccharide transport system permease protein